MCVECSKHRQLNFLQRNHRVAGAYGSFSVSEVKKSRRHRRQTTTNRRWVIAFGNLLLETLFLLVNSTKMTTNHEHAILRNRRCSCVQDVQMRIPVWMFGLVNEMTSLVRIDLACHRHSLPLNRMGNREVNMATGSPGRTGRQPLDEHHHHRHPEFDAVIAVVYSTMHRLASVLNAVPDVDLRRFFYTCFLFTCAVCTTFSFLFIKIHCHMGRKKYAVPILLIRQTGKVLRMCHSLFPFNAGPIWNHVFT